MPMNVKLSASRIVLGSTPTEDPPVSTGTERLPSMLGSQA